MAWLACGSILSRGPILWVLPLHQCLVVVGSGAVDHMMVGEMHQQTVVSVTLQLEDDQCVDVFRRRPKQRPWHVQRHLWSHHRPVAAKIESVQKCDSLSATPGQVEKEVPGEVGRGGEDTHIKGGQ